LYVFVTASPNDGSYWSKHVMNFCKNIIVFVIKVGVLTGLVLEELGYSNTMIVLHSFQFHPTSKTSDRLL